MFTGKFDPTAEELNEMYEYILTLLGAEDVDVNITEKEIRVLGRKALKQYLSFINNWQTEQDFSNMLGFDASIDFTRKFITENTMIAQRISDWFSSMNRVGGTMKWKKDYFTIRENQQVYDLTTESSIPYNRGDRLINRVMWYAKPEMMGSSFNPKDIDGGLLTFGQAGMMYGGRLLSYLGNIYDMVMIAQSIKFRNKVLRSEFFYNISGDIIEITPMPGSGFTALEDNAKVFYYYYDKNEVLQLDGQGDGAGEKELIVNPSQVQMDVVPWSKVNSFGKNWIENYVIALSKYMFGSKLRSIKKIISPESNYEIEFDYESLIAESKEEEVKLREYLQAVLDKLTMSKLMEDKMNIVDQSSKINSYSPRKMFIG